MLVCTLAQWEHRFNNKMECGLENRKQYNTEMAWSEKKIGSMKRGDGELKEISWSQGLGFNLHGYLEIH